VKTYAGLGQLGLETGPRFDRKEERPWVDGDRVQLTEPKKGTVITNLCS
jgi:hypothetical protein